MIWALVYIIFMNGEMNAFHLSSYKDMIDCFHARQSLLVKLKLSTDIFQ